MTPIEFTVTHRFDASPKALWESMIDWPSHGEWIPATRVELDDDRADTVGATFTGYTGYGPLTLVDRMVIKAIDWDEEEQRGLCTVEKLGPVLHGEAGFTIEPDGAGAKLDWFEHVTVRYLPGFLAPIVTKLSAAGFSSGMRKLAKLL